MINRSLIRIKAIQILYSYLLTRNDFKLEVPPAAGDSRDRVFAYSVYLDLIILILKLSGVPTIPGARKMPETDAVLQKNRVAKALRDDSAVTVLLAKNRDRIDKFDSSYGEILSAITASAVYEDYSRKRKVDMADDVNFWKAVFSTVIRKHKGVERVLRRDEEFSHLGFDNGVTMFVDTLASFDDTRATYIKARKELDKSLSLAYTLYHSLLLIPLRLTELHSRRIDANKNKYLPTYEDLNPDLRLVNNLFVGALAKCEPLMAYAEANPDTDPSDWRDGDIMLNSLLDTITASDIYKKYIESPAGNFATDADFWREVMRNIIIPSDELAEALESKSVFWNDDLAIMSTFVLKTIRRSYAAPTAEGEAPDNGSDKPQTTGTIQLLLKFMNHDDEVFGAQLFEYVVKDRETYRAYIDGFIDTKQWDTERLAFMDIVIMMTAIAELIHYPSIPVPVTLNEYIEIANDYSTPRSGQFINGVLFSIANYLREEGRLAK